jgi:hypothetical protein
VNKGEKLEELEMEERRKRKWMEEKQDAEEEKQDGEKEERLKRRRI